MLAFIFVPAPHFCSGSVDWIRCVYACFTSFHISGEFWMPTRTSVLTIAGWNGSILTTMQHTSEWREEISLLNHLLEYLNGWPQNRREEKTLFITSSAPVTFRPRSLWPTTIENAHEWTDLGKAKSLHYCGHYCTNFSYCSIFPLSGRTNSQLVSDRKSVV